MNSVITLLVIDKPEKGRFISPACVQKGKAGGADLIGIHHRAEMVKPKDGFKNLVDYTIY